MTRHKYIVFIILSLTLVPMIVSAATFGNTLTKKSIGGKILKSGPTAEIVCAAFYGPIFMRPFNVRVPGPFFIRYSTKGRPSINSFLLGKYSVIPDLGTCYNPETGVPIPAFELKPYGVSK